MPPAMMVAFISIFLSLSCGETKTALPPGRQTENRDLIYPEGETIETRFRTPEGFSRITAPENSFAAYLRQLPLKPHGETVKHYDGSEKANRIHAAVVNMEIGNRDLQQCADAVMRLRGEYLFAQKDYEKIHFNFTNGFRSEYAKWRAGYRVVIDGNKTSWVKKTEPSGSYADFRKFMDLVFAYAGTLSLSKELLKAETSDMRTGDVFIQGGSPGHAVIVVDMAKDEKTGEKIFMLAQSYMPAQETHILLNLNNKQLSPWYSLDFGSRLETPEWTFTENDLKRFD